LLSDDDPGFREVQESLGKCSKDEQLERRLKRQQMDIRPRCCDLKSDEAGFL
jgi:hypothetical protein